MRFDLSHFVLLIIAEYCDPLIMVLLSTVMASKEVSGIAIHINDTQLIEAFEQSILILSSYAENGIVSEALWQWSASSLLIFHSPLRALLLNFFFNEFAFEAVHSLLDLILRWCWSL
jgi:hypothetical protein